MDWTSQFIFKMINKTKKQLVLKIINQKDKLSEYIEVIKNLKKQIEALESIYDICYVCGTKENLTKHHVFKHFDDQLVKDCKGKITIPLCRECHDKVEDVKKLMLMYQKKEITYQHVKAALKNIDELYIGLEICNE